MLPVLAEFRLLSSEGYSWRKYKDRIEDRIGVKSNTLVGQIFIRQFTRRHNMAKVTARMPSARLSRSIGPKPWPRTGLTQCETDQRLWAYFIPTTVICSFTINMYTRSILSQCAYTICLRHVAYKERFGSDWLTDWLIDWFVSIIDVEAQKSIDNRDLIGNNQPRDCEAQLAWKCLFTHIFFGGRFWPVK